MNHKELDKWIAENVMDWEVEPYGEYFFRLWNRPRQSKKCRGWLNEWHPTESISDAFQIVEKMRVTHFKWFEMAHRPAGYICNFVGDPKYTEFAETAPLAICLAAKKAVEGKKW